MELYATSNAVLAYLSKLRTPDGGTGAKVDCFVPDIAARAIFFFPSPTTPVLDAGAPQPAESIAGSIINVGGTHYPPYFVAKTAGIHFFYSLEWLLLNENS